MKERLKNSWQRTPTSVRKPIVLIVGLLFIIAAGATGWLPGPGGIPLFLIGIAILATEFSWADRVKQFILGYVHRFGKWYRGHRVLGTLTLIALAGFGITLAYFVYSQLLR